MSDLLIRNVDDALAQDIAKRAGDSGRSLSEEAESLLREGLAAQGRRSGSTSTSAYSSIRAIFIEEGAIDDDFALMMDEIEADRKKDPGRRG